LCHQEGCGQLKEECATPASSRSSAHGSRGHPPDPSSGPHCTRTRAAPAPLLTMGSVTGEQPTLPGHPADPVRGSSIDTALEQLRHRGQWCRQRRRPISPIHYQVLDLSNQGPQGLQLRVHLLSCSLLHPKFLVASCSRSASLAQPDGGQRIRSQTLMLGLSRQSAAPLASRIQLSAHPQPPPRRFHWVSAQSTTSSPTISTWRRAVIHIPFDR
jgi:hypothetical protein